MFCRTDNEQIELRLIDQRYSAELFKLFNVNRGHWGRWHPWMEMMRTASDVETAISVWQQLYANNRGAFAGIWFKGQFCGMINHQNMDLPNGWSALSYWLDSAHQGRGIMTACCRAVVDHGFNTWKLNRITIECATQNARSRAIPERLGFKLEGILRGVEWLHGGYVDHALYGLLRSEYGSSDSAKVDEYCRSPRNRPLYNRKVSPSGVPLETTVLKACRGPSIHDHYSVSREAG
jgi:ribosomal-protein-serine acetyltransferase